MSKKGSYIDRRRELEGLAAGGDQDAQAHLDFNDAARDAYRQVRERAENHDPEAMRWLENRRNKARQNRSRKQQAMRNESKKADHEIVAPQAGKDQNVGQRKAERSSARIAARRRRQTDTENAQSQGVMIEDPEYVP